MLGISIKTLNHKPMQKDSRTISVRVPADIADLLDDESTSIGTSVNTLITQVLKKHTQWGRFERELDILHISKQSAKKLFSSLSEGEVKALAGSSCKTMLMDIVLFVKGQLNKENLLEIISILLSANNTSFRHIKTSTTEKFIIKHKLGKNYSLYLSTTISLLFSEINVDVRQMDIDHEDLILEIDL